MNVEVAFGGLEAATNDLEAACDNLFEVLLLIALNLEVSKVFVVVATAASHPWLRCCC